MTQNPNTLQDIHIFGDQTTTRIAHSGKKDHRKWLTDSQTCPILSQFQIHHLGEITAKKPYKIIRNEQNGAFFLSSISGKGEILINGDWTTCSANQAVILPPGHLNAIKTNSTKPWKFHYVRYHQEQGQTPFIRCQQPVIADFSTTSFSHMMNGFLHEVDTHNRAKYTWQWLKLIQLNITDFCEPWLIDDRLWTLWEDISQKLNTPWTLDEIAKKAYLSSEHLRRLTTKTYGRTPMKQLNWLRMQRAAELLICTNDKIEVIGMQCGYNNVNTFTTTFKKCHKLTPSDYRGNLT